MLLENPDLPIRYEPEGEGGPAYLLRVPRHWERAKLEQEAEAMGAEQPSVLELLDALDLALRRQLAEEPERLSRLTEAVAAYRSLLLDPPPGQGLRPPVEVREAEEEMRERDARYRRRAHAQRYYGFYQGCAAAKLFLMGWEGFEEPFVAAPGGGASPSTLDRLPTSHIRGMGEAILRRLMPPERSLGNSGSPPGGGSIPTPSPSIRTPPSSDPPPMAAAGAPPSSAGPSSGPTPAGS